MLLLHVPCVCLNYSRGTKSLIFCSVIYFVSHHVRHETPASQFLFLMKKSRSYLFPSLASTPYVNPLMPLCLCISAFTVT